MASLSSFAFYAAPLWKLAHNLVHLRLDLPRLRYDLGHYSDPAGAIIEEQDEAELAFLQSLQPAQLQADERDALLASLAAFVTVVAAKSGRLRHFQPGYTSVEAAFAIRSLLPYWVSVQTWEYDEEDTWLVAAVSLRRLLAHVSLWINKPPLVAGQYSELSGQDVQLLHTYFTLNALPQVLRFRYYHGANGQPVRRYLPWLQEDAALAQQVADAWNAVLERGEAEEQECDCRKCQGW